MTILGGLFEQRSAVENPKVPLSAASVSSLLGTADNSAGVTVTEETALRLIAVYRCVEMIAGTCAALPLKAFKRSDRSRVDEQFPVLGDPHPELTRFEVWEAAYASLLLWGNAYFRKGYDNVGKVRRLWLIQPQRVRVELTDPTSDSGQFHESGNKRFFVRDQNGRELAYTSREVLHIPGLGYDGCVGMSRIRMAAGGIASALAADDYAQRFFGNGTLLSGILSSEKVLNRESAAGLKKQWRNMVSGLRGAHDIAVLDSSVKFQPISIPPEDAQLLQSRAFSTTEIARLFGLPPHAIGDVEKSTSWGTGIEQQTIGMVQFTLQPSYLTRVEQRLTKEILVDPKAPAEKSAQLYAEYSVEGLLRGDAAARASFYRTMVEIRAMRPNEVRVRENLAPYEGGDEFANPNITPGPAGSTQSDPGAI